MAYVDFAPHNMTSLVLPTPYVVTRSSAYDAGKEAWLCFTGVSWWIGTGSGVDWVSLDIGLGNSKKLYSYSIMGPPDIEPLRAPKNWTLRGSTDDFVTSNDVLDTRTNETIWSAYEVRNFICDTYTQAYRYFRLSITANNGDATYTDVSELYLYYDDTPIASTGNMFMMF